MNPSALVFDAYGTLFDVHAVVMRCETFWPGRGAQLSQLWRGKQLEWTWQRSLMRRYVPFAQLTRDALGYACEALGLDCGETQAAALMEEYRRLALYPEVAEALATLHAGGRGLAILTNGSPDMIVPLLAHHGMQSLFDAVLSVDEVKTYKPSPEVYRLAAKRLGVATSAIGFVSSNGWDALGAKAFGFGAWWINRNAAPLERLGIAPDGILAGLGELPALLAP